MRRGSPSLCAHATLSNPSELAARLARADFSQLAQQLGYKPPARMLEIKSQQADWSTQAARARPRSTLPSPLRRMPCRRHRRRQYRPRRRSQIMYEDDLGFIHRRRRDAKYKQEMKAFSRGRLSNILTWQNRSAIGAACAVAKMARERDTGAARGRCTPTRRPVASRRRLARPQERVLRVWAGRLLRFTTTPRGARRTTRARTRKRTRCVPTTRAACRPTRRFETHLLLYLESWFWLLK